MKKLLIVFVMLLGSSFAQTIVGPFTFLKQTDPITDQDASRLITENIDEGNGGAGAFGWQCRSGKLIAIFGFLTQQTNDTIIIQYRFDKQKASAPIAIDTQNAEGSFLLGEFEERETRAITKAARQPGAVKLVIGVILENGGRAPFTFAIITSDFALKKLSCARGYQ